MAAATSRAEADQVDEVPAAVVGNLRAAAAARADKVDKLRAVLEAGKADSKRLHSLTCSPKFRPSLQRSPLKSTAAPPTTLSISPAQ